MMTYWSAIMSWDHWCPTLELETDQCWPSTQLSTAVMFVLWTSQIYLWMIMWGFHGYLFLMYQTVVGSVLVKCWQVCSRGQSTLTVFNATIEFVLLWRLKKADSQFWHWTDHSLMATMPCYRRSWPSWPLSEQQVWGRHCVETSSVASLTLVLNIKVTGSRTTKQVTVSGGKIMTVILLFKPVIRLMLTTEKKLSTLSFLKMINENIFLS